MTKTLLDYIVAARENLERIRQHPEFQNIEYSPDVMIGDAIQAIDELAEALEEDRILSIYQLEKVENAISDVQTYLKCAGN